LVNKDNDPVIHLFENMPEKATITGVQDSWAYIDYKDEKGKGVGNNLLVHIRTIVT